MKLVNILLFTLAVVRAQHVDDISTINVNNVVNSDAKKQTRALVLNQSEELGEYTPSKRKLNADDSPREEVRSTISNDKGEIVDSNAPFKRVLDNGVIIQHDLRNIQLATCKPQHVTETTYVDHTVSHIISEIHQFPTTIIETSIETIHTTSSSTETLTDYLTETETETENTLITNTVSTVMKFTDLISTTITVIEPKTVVETINHFTHLTSSVTISEYVTEVVIETSTSTEVSEVTEINTQYETETITLNNYQHFTTHGTHYLTGHETSFIPHIFTVTHHYQTVSTICAMETTQTMGMENLRTP